MSMTHITSYSSKELSLPRGTLLPVQLFKLGQICGNMSAAKGAQQISMLETHFLCQSNRTSSYLLFYEQSYTDSSKLYPKRN